MSDSSAARRCCASSMRSRGVRLSALLVLLAVACLDPDELVPPTVDEDDALPALALQDSLFHVRTFGRPGDPVVVFLHGGPGSSMFGLLPYAHAPAGAELASDHFLVFWDQRGAGLSRRHDPAEITWDGYLQDLDALVAHFAPEAPVTLVGYSFGGTYAVAYVDAYPERVDGLVLISPAPLTGAAFSQANFIGGGFSEGTADVLWSNESFAPDDHARMDLALAAAFFDALHPDFHVDPARVPALRRFGAVAQSSLYTELGLVPPNDPPRYDFTRNLHRFDRPVLALVGGQDALFDAAFERAQLAAFDEVELVVVEGWGHDVGFAHAEVAPHLRAYLEGR